MKTINYRSFINQFLCDKIFLPEYDGDLTDEIPDAGVVYVPIDHIAQFFHMCQYTDNKYIVVSAASDYGVMEQARFPVAKDMWKWLPMVDRADIGYNPLIIPQRCNPEHCKITDKYSVKIYSHTRATFDQIPKNIVRWYGTNVNITDPLVVHIPFGCNKGENPQDYHTEFGSKKDQIYVNFTHNTNERLALKRMAATNMDCFLQQETLPYNEYLEELTQYKYVQCPCGNGLDSYRIWETLYVGSIPIIEEGSWCAWNVGYYSTPDYTIPQLSNKDVKDDMDRMKSINPFPSDHLDFDYWYERIMKDRENL